MLTASKCLSWTIISGRRRLPLLALLTLFIFSLSQWNSSPNLSYLQERPPSDSIMGVDLQTLAGQEVFVSELTPRRGSFFLTETAGKSKLEPRVLCTVESAAKHHKNSSIYLILTSKSLVVDGIIAKLSKEYPNIKFRHINGENFILDSELASIWSEGKIQNSRYFVSHLSDLLRFLLLHRFGGTYLDSDQIVLKPFPPEPNFVGKESIHAAAGVMRFQHGHPIPSELLRDLRGSFDGSHWASNGPLLVSRVIRRLCQNSKDLEHLRPENCLGLKLFEPPSFYPLHWRRASELFDESPGVSERVLAEVKEKESYAVHMWGGVSSKVIVPRNSSSAFAQLARVNCPMVAKVYF